MSLCSDGLSSDQYFLLNFIMSNYLGPDVYYDNPRFSASQRLAKGLPPYTLNQIGSSSLTVAQLQCLYSSILRNAKSSLLVHPDMIYMYLKGYLPLEPAGKFPQFTYFFPTNLHVQKRYSQSHEVVKGIVVIDDPAVAFIRNEELQRFRCLSRLDDLKIDRVVSLSPRLVQLKEIRGTEQDCSRNGVAISNGVVSDQYFKSSADPGETCKRKKEEEAVACRAICVTSKTSESQGTEHDSSRNEEIAFNGLVSDQDHESSPQEDKEPVADSSPQEDKESVADHSVEEKEPVADSSPQEDKEPVADSSPQEDKEPVADHSVEEKEPVAYSSPQEDKEPVADHSVEEKEPVADSSPQEDKEPVADHSVEEKEPVADSSPQEDKEPVADHSVEEKEPVVDSSPQLQVTCKRKKEEKEPVADHSVCGMSKTPERFRETYKRRRFKNSQTKATDKNDKTRIESFKSGNPVSMALAPVLPPETKKCDAGLSDVTTGTATKGTLRPSTGAVDIGVNKAAYFFQVALPGVRKDEGKFSCEVESDGKVTLEGSTTGGKTINRYSRVFKMFSPPGPFKLCFSLPGPVDPRLFSPNFRSDGIFEAVIIRNNDS